MYNYGINIIIRSEKMKKTLVVVTFLICIVLCMSALVSCDSCVEKTEKLSAPIVTLEGDTVHWKANENALRLEISIDGLFSFVENSDGSKRLSNGQSFKIRAIGDGIIYTNSDWSGTVTYTESNGDEGNVYTVTFYDENGKDVLDSITVSHGETAVYSKSTPIKNATENHIFEFDKWVTNVGENTEAVLTNITANMSVYAKYCEYLRKYTVSFIDWNGTILKSEAVEYGGTATAPADPTRDDYTFTGWDRAFNNVISDLTVNATYTQNLAPEGDYTVTFYDYDGVTVLATRENVAEGGNAALPANPTKTGTTFLGWKGTYTNVTKNESVIAVYSDNKNVFAIESATGTLGNTVTLLVDLDGAVKTCGFDMTIYYDDAVLELNTYDSDFDLDVIVNDSELSNGVLLNFSAATDNTKQRNIISLTFTIKSTTKTATEVTIAMTSAKEIDGQAIVDTEYTLINGVVTIQ